MPAKTLVCRCEDVTLDDVEHAVSLGYGDIEEVKRYTGLGTGPCQGKECMAVCARLLARAAGATPKLAAPFTARPPLATVALGTLAQPLSREGGGASDE